MTFQRGRSLLSARRDPQKSFLWKSDPRLLRVSCEQHRIDDWPRRLLNRGDSLSLWLIVSLDLGKLASIIEIGKCHYTRHYSQLAARSGSARPSSPSHTPQGSSWCADMHPMLHRSSSRKDGHAPLRNNVYYQVVSVRLYCIHLGTSIPHGVQTRWYR